ncbi:hypothetical protein K1T71_005456 [Dendrolimus kikuchii]|uniref:Uncharacterized protein n=1 Tax=Dendrolimus kikuchii TaxID=765133 RepID=A0ACC1D3Y8_9NEOP|nr:hypothetical protein K1T71_005456 [Dendrolimus kikuchii]
MVLYESESGIESLDVKHVTYHFISSPIERIRSICSLTSVVHIIPVSMWNTICTNIDTNISLLTSILVTSICKHKPYGLKFFTLNAIEVLVPNRTTLL